MSVARSFLLLSAGVVAGGLSMMMLEGEIDWLRYVRGARSPNPLPPPAIVEAPSPPSVPEPAAAPPKRTPLPVPETVVVHQPSSSAPVALRAWPGIGRQVSLAQELQGELQRVGCYGGTIDGVWSPLSQRSAKAFVDGANAHLPVNEPDHALLALVRASRGTVCAKPCLPETRPGADSACKPARPGPESTSATLIRSTPASDPSSVPAHAAQAQPGAASDPVAAALTPLPPTPQQPRQTAAQQKPTPGAFGPDIFGRLNQSRY